MRVSQGTLQMRVLWSFVQQFVINFKVGWILNCSVHSLYFYGWVLNYVFLVFNCRGEWFVIYTWSNFGQQWSKAEHSSSGSCRLFSRRWGEMLWTWYMYDSLVVGMLSLIRLSKQFKNYRLLFFFFKLQTLLVNVTVFQLKHN